MQGDRGQGEVITHASVDLCGSLAPGRPAARPPGRQEYFLVTRIVDLFLAEPSYAAGTCLTQDHRSAGRWRAGCWSPLAQTCGWCQYGTMKRMNLRDVPDDVYAALVAAAEDSRQSLNAFVVDRLSEVAQAVRVADYVSTYPAPRGTGVTTEDAVAAVREVREAS